MDRLSVRDVCRVVESCGKSGVGWLRLELGGGAKLELKLSPEKSVQVGSSFTVPDLSSEELRVLGERSRAISRESELQDAAHKDTMGIDNALLEDPLGFEEQLEGQMLGSSGGVDAEEGDS